MKIGIVGGTGKQGSGLAQRWAKKHEVTIGSRDHTRAEAAAQDLSQKAGGAIRGANNQVAAREAELIVLCVPYAAHAATVSEIAPFAAGKIVLDMTVPLLPPKVTVVHLPPRQAAALESQAILAGLPEGPEAASSPAALRASPARVVAALHHVSSVHLADLGHTLEGDVLVCGDDRAAKDAVIQLIADLGMRGIDAGALQNAIAVEALTPVLLHINRHYKIKGAGLRILGVD